MFDTPNDDSTRSEYERRSPAGGFVDKSTGQGQDLTRMDGADAKSLAMYNAALRADPSLGGAGRCGHDMDGL
jgi:hypothetical protein